MSGTAIAQDHLVTLLSCLNMNIMNSPRLVVPNALGQVKNGQLELTASAEYLQKQAAAFISFLEQRRPADNGGTLAL